MTSSPLRVWCATLGCDKNLVDSEALLGRFDRHGCKPTSDPDSANIWVLNTCGFIAAARADSLEAVADLVAAKTPDRFLAVVGCWAQEHSETIRSRFPEVDLVAGVGQFDEIAAACVARAPGQVQTDPQKATYTGFRERPLLTPPHLAFVKISEGCNCHCTFCRIPIIKGQLRSRSSQDILAEVQNLVAGGVQEIQIVSQNTSDYGRDTGEDLTALIKDLNRVEGLRRIRILYLYAGLITVPTLLRIMDLEKVLPYLDLPIQHASPQLLQAMRRPGDVDSMEAFLMTLRRERPDLVLRTTVLLGFPGEETEDVEILANFLSRVEFDHLGAYRYSPESGTAAATLPGRVPDEVVADREALILDLQAEVSARRQEARLGQKHDILIDRIAESHEEEPLLSSLLDGVWQKKAERNVLGTVCQENRPIAIGRSYHYGYDLDGVVTLPAGDLRPGLWLSARFSAVTAFDTWAVPETSTANRER